ncbi:MAG: hypothetical protein BWZ02_03262 [Lentisphaerae bacterium ADurb.BinA184]|nr:MAG: hypothetical protein BWZ02_03262 [Lentisphaerae bacterium ADurb.BinA184]
MGIEQANAMAARAGDVDTQLVVDAVLDEHCGAGGRTERGPHRVRVARDVQDHAVGAAFHLAGFDGVDLEGALVLQDDGADVGLDGHPADHPVVGAGTQGEAVVGFTAGLELNVVAVFRAAGGAVDVVALLARLGRGVEVLGAEQFPRAGAAALVGVVVVHPIGPPVLVPRAAGEVDRVIGPLPLEVVLPLAAVLVEAFLLDPVLDDLDVLVVPRRRVGILVPAGEGGRLVEGEAAVGVQSRRGVGDGQGVAGRQVGAAGDDDARLADELEGLGHPGRGLDLERQRHSRLADVRHLEDEQPVLEPFEPHWLPGQGH